MSVLVQIDYLSIVAASPASGETHSDPVAPILISLVLIAFAAALGGHLVKKLGQPAVLGELAVGAIVANVSYYLGGSVFTVLREGNAIRLMMRQALTQNESMAEAARTLLSPGAGKDRLIEVLSGPSGAAAIEVYHFVDILSRIAVIVLLFLVGLETSVREMRKVGKPSLFVAIIGVVAPFLLGLGAVTLFDADLSLNRSLFIGVILTATSVGITARIFRDLRQEARPEARIILGAAVIDDVLGLLFLAILTGFITTGTVNVWSVGLISLKAVLFLAGSIALGEWLTPWIIALMARLKIANAKLLFGLGVAFGLSWLASEAGLASIVGAFAAGLVLEEIFFDELREEHSLRHLLSPLESLIVPIFFVLIGMQVKAETFADLRVALMAGGLTTAAILGKLVSGLGCSASLSRLAVGVGMMPRGEVALIFAGIGKGLGVIGDGIFSAVVVMVFTTTFLTPPLLKFALRERA